MASLPWDIIMDILSRLPIKDLVRYRCVCKRWCSLINGPDFIKMHLHHQHSSQNTSCVYVTVNNNLFWVDDLHTLESAVRPTNPLGDSVLVVGSCNGLLALQNTQHDLALWNPCTRRFRKLPEIPRDDLEEVVLGFGHDPLNDDYKLVRLSRDWYGYHDYKIKVYSAKSNTWKSIINHDFSSYCTILHHNGTVLLRNALHWLVSWQKRGKDFKSDLALTSFDLVTEESGEMVLPEYNGSFRDKDLHVIGGSLCVILKYPPSHNDVWMMKEYGVHESWTKLFSLVLPLYSRNVSFVSFFKKNGCDGVVLKNLNKLIRIDLETKSFEKEVVLENDIGYYYGPTRLAHACVGSLVGLYNTSTEEFGWKLIEENAKEKESKG